MKTKLKIIGGFPPIRIAFPALRISETKQTSRGTPKLKQDELMSVFRQDLATLIEQRHGNRVCSRVM